MVLKSNAITQLMTCLAVLPFLALAQQDPRAPFCTENADIIFVVDASSSVEESDFRRHLAWAADVTEQFQLAEAANAPGTDEQGARFGAVVYARSVRPLFTLGTYGKHSEIREALMSAPYLEESSHTHAALLMVDDLELFSPNSGGRVGAKDVVVLISDGKSSYPIEALIAAHHLKTAGVTIFTASLTPEVDVVALRRLASDSSDVFRVSEMESEQDNMLELSERICKESMPEK